MKTNEPEMLSLLTLQTGSSQSLRALQDCLSLLRKSLSRHPLDLDLVRVELRLLWSLYHHQDCPKLESASYLNQLVECSRNLRGSSFPLLCKVHTTF